MAVESIPDQPGREIAFEPLLDELLTIFCPGWEMPEIMAGEHQHHRCEVIRCDGMVHLAEIDWTAAIAALDDGALPCSGCESSLLRFVASLSIGIPVGLSDAVTGVDHNNVDLLVTAIEHAAGRHRAPSGPGSRP